MPPNNKRGRSFGGNRSNNKKKKLNLMTIRQGNDYKKYGELHPAEAEDRNKPRKYTRVKDTVEVKPKHRNDDASSSSDEEEAPALQQLLQEMGVKEEDPESEIDDDEDGSENEEDLEENLEEEDAGDDVEEDEDDDEDIEEEIEGSHASDGSDSGHGFLDAEAGDEDSFDEDEEEIVEEDEEESFEDDEESFEEDEEESVEEEENESDNQLKDSDSVKTNGKKLKGKATKKAKRRKILDSSSDENEIEPNGTVSDDEDDSLIGTDPFSVHFETEVDADEFTEKNKVWVKKELKVPGIGKSIFMHKDAEFLREILTDVVDLKTVHVKHKLCNKVAATNAKFADVKVKKGDHLSPFQHKLFNVLNTYQDLLYPKQTVGNTEEIRLVYCLHVLNHVLKTRSRIVAHNIKLKHRLGKTTDEDVEYRDQGLTRPKVVILVPYRDKAKKTINMIIDLLSDSKKQKAASYNRFIEEYSEIESRPIAGRRYKAEDYIKTFEGNIDDNFRIGMRISKVNVKLYTPLYASDIIIASPLGLRTLIGNPGDEEREFDFLASIEMLIMDQCDIFTMQNWDHVLHILRHFHVQPKKSHDVDFSRVRMWAIDGLTKFFRQTLVFSSILLPEFTSIFKKYCHNYCGKILVEKIEKVGTVRSCLSDVPQIFHRVPCSRPDGVSMRNAKLEYFRKKILPLHSSTGMKRTLIYCNYFSFVMLRNLFREEEVFFLFIHEYDWEKDIKKNRVKFRKLSPPFLFYTERLHFHYRFRLRGVYHLVWFDVPQYPLFYPELVNLMDVTKQACTTTCLFTKYEGQKLMEIVGQKNASHMLNSEKTVNMITIS